MRKRRYRGWLLAACLLALVTGCGEKKEADTPTALTESYLEQMKEGAYEEAARLTGSSFDQEAYENSAGLQKQAMKEAYGQMEYEVQEEKAEEEKAVVTVTVKNADYTQVLDEAIYETMEAGEDDAFTLERFQELLKEAEKKEVTVLVNYRKEEGKWIFDGSNSQLQAAMLGCLDA